MVAQSRSVSVSSNEGVNLAKLDDSIMSKIGDLSAAAKVDEDFVILTGRCQNTRLPYLIKYERMPFNFDGGNFSMRLDRYNMAG